jgi:hypothetical protein
LEYWKTGMMEYWVIGPSIENIKNIEIALSWSERT